MAPRDPYTIKLPKFDPRSASKSMTTWYERRNWARYEGDHSGLIPVQHDSGLKLQQAVYQLAVYFRREFQYDVIQFSVNEPPSDDTAFLWVPSPLREVGGPAIGAASFRWRQYRDAPSAWGLAWVWLHPFERGRGHLKKAWPFFRSAFGNFDVEKPLSSAMAGFLKSVEPNGSPAD